MKSFYDIQQFLKRYGTIIYTGERMGDIELMEMEIEELSELQLIDRETYLQAKLILRNERSKERNRKEL